MSMKDLSDRENKIYRVANNVLYFDDGSDYEAALWQILFILNPKVDEYEHLEYIGESEKDAE